MNNDLNKQATIAAIERINAVEGFDPSVLAVDYSDLSSNETRRRLPVMSQMAWFRLKYPEGRIAVTVTAAKRLLRGFRAHLCALQPAARSVFG